jgi:hypothetical protein
MPKRRFQALKLLTAGFFSLLLDLLTAADFGFVVFVFLVDAFAAFAVIQKLYHGNETPATAGLYSFKRGCLFLSRKDSSVSAYNVANRGHYHRILSAEPNLLRKPDAALPDLLHWGIGNVTHP